MAVAAAGTRVADRPVAGTMDRPAADRTDRTAADRTAADRTAVDRTGADRPVAGTGTTVAGSIRWPALGSTRWTAVVRAVAIRRAARLVVRSPRRSATVGSVDACTLRIRSCICRRPASVFLRARTKSF